jgi:hypothetical protein
MSNKYKFVYALLIFAAVLSCSTIKEKFTKVTEDAKEELKETTKKENSGADLEFYNKYIDASNKLTEAVDNVRKAYLSEIPDPKKITKSSMIFLISTDVYVTMGEGTLKNYKRSYFDNGELSKLSPDNEDMKKEVEDNFKKMLTAVEDYFTTARKVADYYKSKEYEKDLSKAVPYDTEMTEKYEAYNTAESDLSASLKKHKPARERKNPDDYSNPDEKAVVILLNTYEDILGKAEIFYEEFEKVQDNSSDLTTSKTALEDMKAVFESNKKSVESAKFSESTKYMKYSFEDYFSKTMTDFTKSADKFLAEAKGMNANEFSRGYDEVVRNYNMLINAYNTQITTWLL